MNDTAVLTNAPLGERPEIKPVDAARALPWAALLVLGCSASLVAVSFAGKTPLSTTWPLVLAAIVVLGSFAVGLASRRRNWTHRQGSGGGMPRQNRRKPCLAKPAHG